MQVLWVSHGERDVPSDDDWLTERERERALSMRYTKRRTDYRLGRWTAKRAVAQALRLAGDAASLAEVEIRNVLDGPHRGAPQVFVRAEPAGLSISMTDRAGWAVCAVHRGDLAIGCDLELVEPRSAAFVADFLTPSEQAVVAAAPTEADAHCLANLIWCAKESALKVLRTGLRRDTRSVEVRLDDDAGVDAWARLTVVAEEGGRFPGWWRRYGDFLLTIAAETMIAAPAAMLEPPALRDAVPTHSWLSAPLVGTPGTTP